MSKETWHGWIVVTKSEGYADHFHVEYVDDSGVRRRELDTTSPAECIEWWDKRLKKPIKLIATPLGAYRVYTEEIPTTAEPDQSHPQAYISCAGCGHSGAQHIPGSDKILRACCLCGCLQFTEE